MNQRNYLQCGDRVLALEEAVVMGVLNVTPDSFSDGGAMYCAGKLDVSLLQDKAAQMVEDGAKILDIGGESTRPGAPFVSLQEEMDRVMPALVALNGHADAVVSIDTSRPEVILEAARLGAGIINDVRGLTKEGALQAAASTQLGICLMHMQGQPDTMQDNPFYQNVMTEVSDFLSERVTACIASGVEQARLMVDPGFGFGKKLDNNLHLLAHLSEIKVLDCPILVGMSRKSMIGKILNNEPHERLAGSLAAAVLAVNNGAKIIRAHDVKATYDAVTITNAVIKEVRE